MERKNLKYFLIGGAVLFVAFCACITGSDWIHAKAMEHANNANNTNTVQERKHYLPNDTDGVCYEYFKTEDGRWSVNGKKYNFRVVLAGRSPNAVKDTEYVVLTNNKDISFEEVNWSILSSNSNDDLEHETVCIVEIR